MPRPGPRPYECVRRAWHSDRHQPMRGSIIRHIFRVVTESHSSATRKNREWQEKLPRVVLRAEEIIYSKANSEAEYMDPDTLWERLNDAVDTIIRRDENETGQFLQPCIEAALVLGCVPVRASRSQRHSNPRSYLSPRFQEPAQIAAAIPDKTHYHRPPPQPPNASSSQLSTSRSANANQAGSVPLSNTHIAPNTTDITTHTGPQIQPNFHRPMPSSSALKSSNSLHYGSVYPLFYGCHFQNIEPQFGVCYSPQNSNPNNIIVGKPVGWPVPHPAHFPSTRNLLPGGSEEVSAEFEQVNRVESHGKSIAKDCDLSLRLGPSDPCLSTDNKVPVCVSEDGGSSSQQKISKGFEHCARNLEFSFFPSHNAIEPSKSCNEGLKQGEVRDRNVTSSKRKPPEDGEPEDRCIQWMPQLQTDKFGGQIRWGGL